MPQTIEHRPISERTRPQRRTDERRDPDFVVRVKTGASRRSWTTIGFAWKRENGEGFSVKLNALPIGNEWNGVLKMLPPYMGEDEIPSDEQA
jgi:hypothetical protein